MYEILLYACTFASGVVIMALEMLIGRTLTPYFGGTVYTWGALISVFLAGMASGYAIAGHIADRRPTVLAIAVGFGFASLALTLPPLGSDAILNAVLDHISDVRLGALAAALCLAFAPAALLASVSPYCMRLLLREAHSSGSVSGRLSALSTVGSIIGALMTSFFLIPTLGVKTIYVALSVLSGLFAALALSVFVARRVKPGSIGAATIAVLVSAALAAVGSGKSAHASAANKPPPQEGIIEAVDSEYNRILIERSGSQIAMEFGYRALRYTESVIDLARPDELVVPYTRYLTLGLAYPTQQVRRVALVGLGGGHTAIYLVRSAPGLTADVGELDPDVIRLSEKYFGVRPSQNLNIVNQDGRVFLQRANKRYDAILLDAYRGPFVPFHLTTKEFYTLVKARLTPGGVVVQNVDPSTLFFDSTYLTMKAVFANVDVYHADGNVVLIGYDGPALSDQALKARAAARQKQLGLKYDLGEMAATRSPSPVVHGKILTDDFAPVEMLTTIKRNNVKRQ
jgi:spermidine synthase